MVALRQERIAGVSEEPDEDRPPGVSRRAGALHLNRNIVPKVAASARGPAGSYPARRRNHCRTRGSGDCTWHPDIPLGRPTRGAEGDATPDGWEVKDPTVWGSGRYGDGRTARGCGKASGGRRDRIGEIHPAEKVRANHSRRGTCHRCHNILSPGRGKEIPEFGVVVVKRGDHL